MHRKMSPWKQTENQKPKAVLYLHQCPKQTIRPSYVIYVVLEVINSECSFFNNA